MCQDDDRLSAPSKSLQHLKFGGLERESEKAQACSRAACLKGQPAAAFELSKQYSDEESDSPIPSPEERVVDALDHTTGSQPGFKTPD